MVNHMTTVIGSNLVLWLQCVSYWCVLLFVKNIGDKPLEKRMNIAFLLTGGENTTDFYRMY
jgi:hypothetical protein